MKKPIPPCHKCPDRYVGCHAECGKYQTFVEKNEAYKADWAKKAQTIHDLAETKINCVKSVTHGSIRQGSSMKMIKK